MSKIDEMIKELFPEGLMYKSLGELADEGLLSLGRGQIISKNDMRETPGDFPVYSSSSQNNGEIGSYGKYMFDDERITWSIDGGGILFYRNNLKYSVTNVCGWLKVNCPDVLSTKYLYYTMFQQWTNLIFDYTHKAHPSVIRDEYIIPLPPLCIQQEIVSVLDSFTTLIDKMKQEVEKRKKQMEYYREKLLTFENGEYESYIMNDVISFLRTGLNPRTHFALNTDDADGMYVTVRELAGKTIVCDEKTDRINLPAAKRIQERSKLKKGDILFSGTGTIGRTAIVYEDPVTWNIKEGVYAITPNYERTTTLYLLYALQTNNIMGQIHHLAEGGAVKSIAMKDFRNLCIELPSLSKQREIVSTLDKFESYITKLEKMITLRQKQYEYYREQLLTF